MIVLPVIGGLASLLGALIVGGALGGIFAALGTRALGIVAIFGALWAAGAISIFFQVAVVFAATDRLEGRTPTVGGSIAQAWSRRSTVVRWALLAAAVGMLIQAVEQARGHRGSPHRLPGRPGLGGGHVLRHPHRRLRGRRTHHRRAGVLVAAQGPLRHRGALVIRFGITYLGWMILAMVVLVAGIALVGPAPALGIPVAVIGFGALMVVGALVSTVGMYLRTILYRFATDQPLPGIDLDLGSVFGPKPAR